MAEKTTHDAIDVRPAVEEDYDDVVAFTQDTWGERPDYIPRVFHDWVVKQGDRQLTLVAELDGSAVGLAQAVLLSDTEAWGQGMRVDPDYRGQGVGNRIATELMGWAREQGAEVMRNMVFSWNGAGLGQSRSIGYDPLTEFRWVHPEPAGPQDAESASVSAIDDVEAVWEYWEESTARESLHGVALDMDESWALRELRPEMVERAADETALLAVGEDTVEGFAYRCRTYTYETDGEGDRWAEYGVAAWDDIESCKRVMAAIGANAASVEADRTRVLIPETVRAVSDVARHRVEIAEHPDFVLELDLAAFVGEG